MVRPAFSAAAITSVSRTEPPGWTTAVTPAAARSADNDRTEQLATWHDDDQSAQRRAEDLANTTSTTAGDATVPW